MRIAWRALIAVGALLALVAISLDTSVSTGYGRVHNIGLQSQQQMLLILGCVLFLAGVVLFAVAKIKQTPEEDARDRAAEEAVQAKLKGAITEWKRRGDERVELLESRRIGDRGGEAGKRETRAKRVWRGVWHLVRRPYVLGVGILVVGTYALNPLYEETHVLGSMGEISVPTRHVIFTTDAPMLVGDYVFTLLWQIALFGFLYWKARR